MLCTDNPISIDLHLSLFKYVLAAKSHIATAIGYSLFSSIAYTNDLVVTAVSTFTAMSSQSVNVVLHNSLSNQENIQWQIIFLRIEIVMFRFVNEIY